LNLTGIVRIDNLDFDIETQTFTCISSGGPASIVTWRRNNRSVEVKYSRHQQIVNTVTAEYHNILMLNSEEPDNVVGHYVCSVSNERGEDEIGFQLQGILHVGL
jgi:hypothetical protein